MDIGFRLREERERLGLTQAAFGELGGSGKTTVLAWEAGGAYPNARFLAAVAAAGVDVRYVITGTRDYKPPPALSAAEREMLDLWRAASNETRRAARGALVGAPPAAVRIGRVYAGPIENIAGRDVNFHGKPPHKRRSTR